MSAREPAGAYWARTLAAGAAFMAAAEAHPLEDAGEPVTGIAAAADAAGVRIDCSARVHRTGRPVDLRLRRSNVEALLGVAARLDAGGLLLVVEDALRTPADQAALGRDRAALANVAALLERHALAPDDDELVAWLGVMIAATPRTAGHVAGAAVDVTVREADGSELDRGATYPNWSEKMPMDSPFVTAEQAAARALVNEAMAAEGFAALPFEFWHYSRGDAVAAVASGASAPACFGPVAVDAGGAVAPLADHARFNAPAELLRLLRATRAALA